MHWTQWRRVALCYLTSSDMPTKLINADSDTKGRSVVGPESGLCLLCCYSELNSSYDCEALEVATIGSAKPKIVYRLACRRYRRGVDVPTEG